MANKKNIALSVGAAAVLITGIVLLTGKETAGGYELTMVAGQNVVSYHAGNDKPTVIFWGGIGEDGTDPNKLFVNGPAKFLRDGWEPDYNVVCVQPTYGWVQPSIMQKTIDSVQARYGASSIHLTGLSAGAASIFDYIARQPNHEASSIVVFSYGPVSNQKDWSLYPHAWALTGDKDSYTNVLTEMVNGIKAEGKTAKLTVYSGGHCCWNTYYNPEWRQDGKNVYEWMISFAEDKPTPPEPPTGGQKILLPISVYQTDVAGKYDVQPGDTLVIPEGGQRYALRGFHGTKEKPVVITQANPKKPIGLAGDYIISIESATYFKVWNINIDAGPNHRGFNLAMGKWTSDYEVDGYFSRYGNNGIKASWNPVASDPTTQHPNSINNIVIKNVTVKRTVTEGLYLGNTQSVSSSTSVIPPRIVKLKLRNIWTDSTGWDGTQVASTDSLEMFGVTATNFGLADSANQQAGILVGGYVTAAGIVDSLKIDKGTGGGLTVFARGKLHFRNVSVTNSETGVYADDYSDGGFGLPPQQIIFENMTVTGSKQYDIEIRNSKGTALKTTYENVSAAKIKDNTGGSNTNPDPPDPEPPKEIKFHQGFIIYKGKRLYYVMYLNVCDTCKGKSGRWVETNSRYVPK